MSDVAPPGTGPAAAGSRVPLDANDTRGAQFKRLLVHPATLITTGVLALAAFIALAASGSVAAGGVAVAIIFLGALLIVFVFANSLARKDFLRAYAQGRGLRWSEARAPVPPLTSLLRKGDERYLECSFNGTLPGGLDGTLAYYTYEDESTDSEGNSSTTYYHFTVAMSQLPETAPLLQELAVQRRSGFRFLDSAEDKFRKRQRVEVESEAADRRYEIFIGAHDDMNRARQVLSPSFIVWLAEQAPDDFAFELAAGSLVCAVKGHKKKAAELDALCQGSSAVARRLAEEARE